MLYFSGFCLKNEQELFEKYINNHDYEVVGFSYGAIKAFKYALTTTNRIDTITLLSPAFFQNKGEKFKRLQLLYYKKDSKKYIENFLKNTTYPCNLDLSRYLYQADYKDLQELLYFIWDKKKLQTLLDKDIKIDIHIGEKDKIINTQELFNFFKPYATIYLYKNKGHVLCKP